jgi:hypothetical protein
MSGFRKVASFEGNKSKTGEAYWLFFVKMYWVFWLGAAEKY